MSDYNFIKENFQERFSPSIKGCCISVPLLQYKDYNIKVTIWNTKIHSYFRTKKKISWFYSVSHKESNTSRSNCIREHRLGYWCWCDKLKESWGILWSSQSSAKEMQTCSLPFYLPQRKRFLHSSGRKTWSGVEEEKSHMQDVHAPPSLN